MKNVVIVESPAKAKTIEKYLGKDYTVLASFGHVRDLPSKNGSVDVENDFHMHYSVPKDSEKQIKAIVSAVKKADTVYLATDLDREGEAISWHVYEELKERIKDMSKRTVHRIEFSEITKKAIQEAVANPRDLAMNLINAQQARRALDYLVGFNLSPVLWKKVRPGLSAGRVQSVALRLICEREDEIDAFIAQEYWSIEATFSTPEAKNFTAKLVEYAGEKLEKFSINNEADATKATQTLEGLSYSVADVVQKQVRRNPGPPFITSTLQIEASRKLRFGARKTMQVAQRLYEAGHITYMRTDSVHLAGEALNSIRGTIGSQYGSEYVPEKPNFYKTKTQNAQEAHEAIRPTDASKTGDQLGLDDEDQRKLYRLIRQRTLACQMTPAKLDQTTLTVRNDGSGEHAFRASGSVVAFDGFMRAYTEGKENEQDVSDDDEKLLPRVEKQDAVGLEDLHGNQHFTEPPPRYSEATLVKALEENGIGRPSTYASIVSTIRDRGYVTLDARRFKPEDVGRIVNKFLVAHFSKYVDLGFTAELEEELDEISRGEVEWKPMLKEFWTPFKELVDDKTTSVKKSDVTSEKTGEECPKCKKGELIIRLGRYGRFKGCSNYPECKYIENLDGTTNEEREKAPVKDTGVTCPKCGDNQIIEKTSRRGKVFYGCAGYPKCDYAVWHPPVAKPCPQEGCDSQVLTVKHTKEGDFHVCPACNWYEEGLPARYRPRPKKKAEDGKDAAKKPAAKKKAPAKKKAATKKKAS